MNKNTVLKLGKAAITFAGGTIATFIVEECKDILVNELKRKIK